MGDNSSKRGTYQQTLFVKLYNGDDAQLFLQKLHQVIRESYERIDYNYAPAYENGKHPQFLNFTVDSNDVSRMQDAIAKAGNKLVALTSIDSHSFRLGANAPSYFSGSDTPTYPAGDPNPAPMNKPTVIYALLDRGSLAKRVLDEAKSEGISNLRTVRTIIDYGLGRFHKVRDWRQPGDTARIVKLETSLPADLAEIHLPRVPGIIKVAPSLDDLTS